MLNSRYAPVIALSVLGIVVVAVLGWFLAISPQFDERDDLATQAATIRTNTDQVNLESAQLDKYASTLAENDEAAQLISVNAPEALDLPAFRARLWSAFNSSRVELVSSTQDGETLLAPVEVDPATLVAAQVAALFQTGPVGSPVAATAGADGSADPNATADPTADAGFGGATADGTATGWAPVVTAPTEETSSTGEVFMVPFTLVVVGTPEETDGFLSELADPEQPVYQVYTVVQEARPADAGEIPGVASPQDGDVQTTITGSLFVRNPARVITDEPLESGSKPPGQSVFVDPPSAPAQAGA